MSQPNQKLEGLPEIGWNHIVVKGNMGTAEPDMFQIREQYGNWGLGQTARTPYGESLDDLEKCLTSMLAAVQRARINGYVDESLAIVTEACDGLPEDDESLLEHYREELELLYEEDEGLIIDPTNPLSMNDKIDIQLDIAMLEQMIKDMEEETESEQ